METYFIKKYLRVGDIKYASDLSGYAYHMMERALNQINLDPVRVGVLKLIAENNRADGVEALKRNVVLFHTLNNPSFLNNPKTKSFINAYQRTADISIVKKFLDNDRLRSKEPQMVIGLYILATCNHKLEVKMQQYLENIKEHF